MTIERLVQLEDLLIWMSGGVVFTSDQADLFSEGLAFISAEIERESMTDEEVQEAIDTLQVIRPSEKEIYSGEYPEVAEAIDLAIEALKAYRPVRENQTTEPVGESEPCYTCKQIEDKYETEVIIRYGFGDYEDFTPDYCPSCGREL